MPYAAHDTISSDPIPGGVEITPVQYAEALGRIANGERVTVIDGQLTYYRGPVYLLDEEDYLAGTADVLPEGAPLITGGPDPALVRPRWNGVEWAEGEDPAKLRAAAIARMTDAIKAERDRRQQEGGFLVAGEYWFHSDNSSRIQQMRLDKRADELLAAGGSEADPIVVCGIPVQWKLMDGTFVPMTAGLAKQIGAAAEAQEALLFQVAETHIAAMAQSPEPAAYDYSSGWPTAFWERE